MSEALNAQLTAVESETDDRYLIFKVVNDEYGIAISYVLEIISMQSITMVPELPDYMIGVINLRGTIIPVMDARKRFMREAMDYNERTCIIVVILDDMQLGLVVDTVEEVLDIAKDMIVDPPTSEAGQSVNRYIQGIVKMQNGIKQIVDCRAIFGDPDMLG